MKKVLIVDDEKIIRYFIKNLLEPHFEILEAENQKTCKEVLQANKIDIVILDLKLPDNDSIFELLNYIVKKFPKIKTLILSGIYDENISKEALALGAKGYLLKTDAEQQLVNILKNMQLPQEIEIKSEGFKMEIGGKTNSIFIPEAPEYQRIYELALKTLSAGLNILIEGETGTGKGFLAQYLHKKLCADKPIITLNCGAICSTISESELLGCEKGAYTDAHQDRAGKIELAHNGILFLDEIGNMPLEIQKKILTVIEDRKITRLGSTKERSVDFSLISATNTDLKNAILQKTFRADLFYRICQVPIRMPSLREVPQAIPQFVKHFVDIYTKKYAKKFVISPQILEYIGSKAWRGNLRELKNEIQTMVALGFEDFLKYANTKTHIVNAETVEFDYKVKKIIGDALLKSNYNVAQTADYLGLKRTTLLKKIRSLKIEYKVI
jgi:DNA-binding NtrC family response regulator